jgi:hypothetical protein
MELDRDAVALAQESLARNDLDARDRDQHDS